MIGPLPDGGRYNQSGSGKDTAGYDSCPAGKAGSVKGDGAAFHYGLIFTAHTWYWGDVHLKISVRRALLKSVRQERRSMMA